MKYKGMNIHDLSEDNLIGFVKAFVSEHPEWGNNADDCIEFLKSRDWCTKKGKPIENLDATIACYYQYRSKNKKQPTKKEAEKRCICKKPRK